MLCVLTFEERHFMKPTVKTPKKGLKKNHEFPSKPQRNLDPIDPNEGEDWKMPCQHLAPQWGLLICLLALLIRARSLFSACARLGELFSAGSPWSRGWLQTLEHADQRLGLALFSRNSQEESCTRLTPPHNDPLPLTPACP